MSYYIYLQDDKQPHGKNGYHMGEYFSTAYDKAQRFINNRPDLESIDLYRGLKVVATLTADPDEPEVGDNG